MPDTVTSHPVPCDYVMCGILKHISRSSVEAAADLNRPKPFFCMVAEGRRHLTLAMMLALCERYPEYPDLPDVIANLVRDFLRSGGPPK